MNWNLEYLIKNEQEYEKYLSDANNLVEKMGSYKGKLSNEEDFKGYLLAELEFEKVFGRLYLYAHLNSDLNKKNVENAGKYQKCMMVINKLSVATSFEEPELLSIGKEKVLGFIDNNKELEQFRFAMEKLFRKQAHILSPEAEEILSNMSPMNSAGNDLYSALSVADGKPAIALIDGKEVKVTQGNWTSLVSEYEKEEDRKAIFEALYKYFDDHKTTYATIYEGILKKNKAYAKIKKYDSILESYLYGNNIPTSVFTNLVDVASNNNDSLKKYIQLRKKYLGLKEYHTYDRFLELAKSDKKYTFEEAKNIFFDSIKDCPKDFQDKAHDVLKEGFVDVFEKEGKRSGAYSSSMADLHPFILLNYNGTLDDVFTVAHESGHSIHTLYSMEAQPTMLQDYTIFVAEIASTFNEHMLLDYFMKSNDLSKNDKIALLQKAIDEIMSTFYRQTLFANYEYKANELIANDQVINHEVLSGIMTELYSKYYGLDLNKEPYKNLVWCYIPHLFYTPFYVYQYATSFAASFKLYKNVKENKEVGFENYLKLLKSGGSKFPMQEALESGVDFTDKATFMAVVERMDDLVSQLEKLLNE